MYCQCAYALFPFLFVMYLNDLEKELDINGVEDINIDLKKLFLLLYADDIVLFGKTPEELQKSLKNLEEYCKRWKHTVNTNKTKIVVFGRGCRLPNNLEFSYNGKVIEIVNKFSYLGIVFNFRWVFFRNAKKLYPVRLSKQFLH